MAHITTRDGVRLRIKDWGQGRPVVLLHGWPLSSDTFDDLALAIANAGFRAISYDRRGFGRSDQPWTGYDYDTLADDLASVIEQTEARGATLVGFSMGGGEVARYLSRYPDNSVASAVLISSVVPGLRQADDNPEGVDPATIETMIGSITTDRAKYWSTFFEQFYGVGLITQPASDETLAWSSALAMQASLKATLDCVTAFAMTDFRQDLSAFKVPTLIIHGTSDKTVPIDATAHRAAAGIPGSLLREYDGGPHGLLASHKDQLSDDILAFLRNGSDVEHYAPSLAAAARDEASPRVPNIPI
jgi:pimeloyl-ACP methyl ester carboxylesterase